MQRSSTALHAWALGNAERLWQRRMTDFAKSVYGRLPARIRLQGVGLRNTEKLSSRRRLGLSNGGRAGGGELLACNFQRSLDPRRLRMRFAEYEFIRFCDELERLHTFAEIVERSSTRSSARTRSTTTGGRRPRPSSSPIPRTRSRPRTAGRRACPPARTRRRRARGTFEEYVIFTSHIYHGSRTRARGAGSRCAAAP